MILTDDEIRKAAEFAAEQMWPESGYVGWTEDDAVFHRKFVDALLEKLRGGVELPEAFAHAAYEEHPSYEGVGDIVYYHPNAKPANCIDLFTRRQLLAYGAAQRLAGQQQWLPIESAPQGTMILCANMKAREAKGWCFVAWVVDGKVCGHRMDMPTHWQPLPHPPASPQINGLRAALQEQAREGEAVANSAILARGRFHAFKGEDGEPDDWEWFEEGTNCEHGCIDAVIVRADAIAAPQPAQPLTDEDCTRIYNEANNITVKNPPISTARVFAAMRAAHIHGSTT